MLACCRPALLVVIGGCDLVFPLRAPDAVPDATLDAVDSLDAPADAPRDAFFGCPASYDQPFNGHVYRFELATQKTWLNAAADCADDETGDGIHFTHLAVLGDEQERSGVQALAPGRVLWLGLSDINQEATFLWVTAEATSGYPPSSGALWSGGAPNGDGDCVQYVGDADLDDLDCSVPRLFVCECDQSANVPSRYGQ